MAYTVKLLSDLPVVITEAQPGFQWQEQPAVQAEVRPYLDAATQPLFYVIDITRTKIDFETVMQSTNRGARSEGSTWRHPNLREMMFVSADPLVKRAVAGMNSAAFGFLEAKTFDTLDEARAYIRSQM